MVAMKAQRALSRWQQCGLAAASGVLLTLLYPPFSLSVLAWVALTPLIVALDGAPLLIGLFLGWLTGTIESLGVTGFWMYRAARDYFQLSAFVAAAFTVGVNQVFVALYLALFGFAASVVTRGPLRFLLIPAWFVTTEYLRAHFLSGNPWELLGHSQGGTAIIQLCDLTGVYGLSFLLALSATAVAEIRRTRVPAVVAATTTLLVLLYGQSRLAHFPVTDGPHLPMAMVQANLPNDQRGRPEFFAEHLDRYLELTRQAQTSAAPAAAALIIWPENAIGFFPEDNPSLLARITEQLQSPGTALLAGAPHAGGRPNVAALFNAAYLFTADGVSSIYDKRVLLPFVERVPLRPEDGPYLPGTEPTIFSVAGTRFGTLICYEAIYPELARELVTRGAQFLINISNDSWFEAGAGPEQHYEIVRFRAVENRVSLVRVTNSGVSAVVDPAGREVVRLPSATATAQSASVPLGTGGSFYTRHGDLFAMACIALSLGALVVCALGHLPH
jgi:apolipoprotein N-acyltransferase